MGRTADDKIRSFLTNGWCPVPYAHHPKPIRDALREVGLRPAMKQCFANCQRLLVTSSLDLEYHEGWAVHLIPFEHAWLVWEGQRIDLTLRGDDMDYRESIQYTKAEVLLNAVETSQWAVMDPRALAELHPMRARFELLQQQRSE